MDEAEQTVNYFLRYEKEKAIGHIKVLASPLRPELHSLFQKLKQFAFALLTSEKSSTFNEITKLILGLNADSFILTEFEYRIITRENAQLHQLLDLVKQMPTEPTLK